jgi:hypothetical protein
VAATQRAGGPDYRLAVLPSLAAWVGTIVLAFLCARRLAPGLPNGAGAMAAALVAASPGMRAFATDIMLESLGACLSLGVLYAAVRYVATPTRSSARWLALALTLLFYEKYNYWFLVVLALGLTVATALPSWRRWDRGRVASLLRELALWHALPCAVWLAPPMHLSRFLWIVSPENHPLPRRPLAEQLRFYAQSYALDYHASRFVGALVIVLAVAAAAGLRRRAGARVIAIFFGLCAVLTVAHPHQGSRFMHSWIAAGWVLAGVGAASVIAWTVRRLPRCPPFAPVAAATLACLALVAAGWRAAPAVPEGGVHPGHPSLLDMADLYLPGLAGGRKVAILSNLPMRYFARWSYRERYPDRERPVTDIRGLGDAPTQPEAEAIIRRWLAETPVDSIVMVDIAPGSPWYEVARPSETQAGIAPALDAQTRFTLAARHVVPRLGVTVSVFVLPR